MPVLHSDNTFNYELLRVIGGARYFGADIGEVLSTIDRINAGDFESWYSAFVELADHVKARGKAIDSQLGVSVRDAMFHASSYYRSADFFLHGNASDARIDELWREQSACFDEAIARLAIPGERINIPADGFSIPAILYRATDEVTPRPTLLLCNGYDGSQEEMLHVCGFAALERGFHVITFEGPGQPTPRRNQQLGFIPNWEAVVTPVIDFLESKPFVDQGRLGLLGYSFGGYLVARAAAFDSRIAATMCVDGIFSAYEAFTSFFPPQALDLLHRGEKAQFDAVARVAMAKTTNLRWALDQGLWSFNADGPYDWLQQVKAYTMAEVVQRIQCPVLVCEAENDRFFKGQPKQLADALGDRGTYHAFTQRDAAAEHCHVGANVYLNQVVLDWFEKTVGRTS